MKFNSLSNFVVTHMTFNSIFDVRYTPYKFQKKFKSNNLIDRKIKK